MNYYERHLGDYARDAGHLSMLEHGAYTLLTDRYYAKERGLPEGEVYRLTRARSAAERQAVDSVLAEFFTLRDGVWVKNRAEEEIAKYRRKRDAAQSNGRKGGRPRKTDGEPKPEEEETQKEPTGFSLGSNSETQPKAHQTPDTNNQKEKATRVAALSVSALVSDGLPVDLAQEFLAHRNRKKAALTPRAWDGIKSEVAKAGWTIPDAVQKALSRGWTSFEAEWVARERPNGTSGRLATLPHGSDFGSL